MVAASNQASDKTGKVAHYIITHTEPAELGLTKLCEVMWHADVSHYRLYGRTITGQMSYERKDYGPVPNNLYAHLRELGSSQAVVERSKLLPTGMRRREFIYVKPAKASWFSSEEIEMLHEAIAAVVPLSAQEASERTHGPLWEELEDGQQMSIRAASVISSEIRPEDVDWALKQVPATAV